MGDKNTKAVFITQNEEDHLLLNLTVEEAIRFASRVKNNSSCTMVSKCIDSDLVSSIIDQLDLERCRYTLVGKCSGGQKKRLAIAQELASNIKPKIIFMDEPTSGECGKCLFNSLTMLIYMNTFQVSIRVFHIWF